MRRCRHCKAHHIPKDAPKSQWWGDDTCKRAYITKPKKAKAAKPAKKKLKSIARLVDEAAVLLQKLVRMKAADANGYVRCVGGEVLHWTEAQGGHFLERGRLATKLVEENVHPQSPGDNMFKMKTATGVLAYYEFMVGMYGEPFVTELIRQSKQTKKYTRHEVEAITFDFKRQIAEQEKRLSGQVSTERAA